MRTPYRITQVLTDTEFDRLHSITPRDPMATEELFAGTHPPGRNQFLEPRIVDTGFPSQTGARQ